jgi:hypothetical protein
MLPVAMSCAKQLGRFLFAALIVFAIAPNSYGLVIAYELEDLPDAGGFDVWEYRYFLSDGSFLAGQGFSTRFPLHDALNLTPVATGAGAGVDWDLIALQPDSALGEDGLFDALARVDGATFAEPFVVHFAWTGAGLPGKQIFEVYDSEFDVIASGETVPVPEPVTSGLLGGGLAWLAFRRTRNSVASGRAQASRTSLCRLRPPW